MRSAVMADDPAKIGFELQRRFHASPERVFRAWTLPVALREWWCPPGWVAGEIEVDLKVGGTYRIAMTRTAGGAPVAVSGQFLEVDPPERLVYSWCCCTGWGSLIHSGCWGLMGVGVSAGASAATPAAPTSPGIASPSVDASCS